MEYSEEQFIELMKYNEKLIIYSQELERNPDASIDPVYNAQILREIDKLRYELSEFPEESQKRFLEQAKAEDLETKCQNNLERIRDFPYDLHKRGHSANFPSRSKKKVSSSKKRIKGHNKV
ncbi:MAG: hypothetical protein ACOC1P_03175 [Minisyncoccales bacterium]